MNQFYKDELDLNSIFNNISVYNNKV